MILYIAVPFFVGVLTLIYLSICLLQRRAYDIEQGLVPEKGDDEFDLVDDEDGEMDPDRKAEQAAVVAQATAAAAAGLAAGSGTAAAALAPPQVPIQETAAFAAMAPMERAKALAAQLILNKANQAAGVAPGTVPIVTPPPAGPVDPQAALARARLIAMQMASKNMGGGGSANSATGESVAEQAKEAHFAEEVEINDYPPQVRGSY